MGGSNSNEKERDLTPAQKQQLQGLYQNAGLNSYDHHDHGMIIHRDTGYQAYEEVKQYQAVKKMNKAKNVNLKASTNDAYILPNTIKIEQDPNYINWYCLKFDYKIAVLSVVMVTLSCPGSQVALPDEISKRRYECNPAIHGTQNTISFTFNPNDFVGYGSIQWWIHIIAQYAPTETKQNENYMYLTFGSSMTSFKVTKNSMRINGKDYEMKTVYGMSGKEDGNDNVCLVCLDNPKNIVLKPCSHMCICHVCAEPMLRTGQKCPICRSDIKEIERLDITQ